MGGRAQRIIALLALPWATLVLFGYFRTHPIVTDRSLTLMAEGLRALQGTWSWTAVAASALDVAAAALVVLIATLAGTEVTRWLRVSLPARDRLVSGYLLGCWLLGLASILLADARLLDRGSVLLLLTALVILVGLSRLLRASRASGSPARGHEDIGDSKDSESTFVDIGRSRQERPDRWCTLMLLLAGLFVVAGWSLALLPPTGWDSLVYHLESPRRYIEFGRWPLGVDGMHFAFPPLLSALYLDLMLLRGDRAAQLLHGTYLVAALIAVYSLAAERRGPRVGALAVLVLSAMPTLLRLAAVAYVDLATLGAYTVAFRLVSYAVRPTEKYPTTSLLVCAGLVASVGADVKYTGLVFAASLLVALAWALGTTGRGWATGRAVIAFGGAFVVGIAPWYLRNLLLNGNPIYPFIFGGPGWDAARNAWFGRAGTGLLGKPLSLLLLPLAATIFGVEGGEGFSANIGPIWLLLLPIGLLLRPGRIRDPLTVAASVVFAWWAIGAAISDTLEQTRLVAPAFGLLAVAAACVLDDLPLLRLGKLPVGRALCFATFGAIVTLGINAAQYWIIQSPLAAVGGTESREATIRRLLPGYAEAMEHLNQIAGPGSRALFLWEPRTYYTIVPATGDQNLDLWWRPPVAHGDDVTLEQSLDQSGYTHLLVSRVGLDFLLRTGHDAIDPSAVDHLIRAQDEGLMPIYGSPIAWDEERQGLAPADLPYTIYRVTPHGH